MENNDAKKPPIGIIPKYLHDEKRFHELCSAISRYYNEGLEIPLDWIIEFNEYVTSKNKKQLSKSSFLNCKGIVEEMHQNLTEHLTPFLQQIDKTGGRKKKSDYQIVNRILYDFKNILSKHKIKF